MSHHHDRLNFDELRIAADRLDRKLNQTPRQEQHQEAAPSTTPRSAYQAHVESAEEADQIFRDEALARQQNDGYDKNSLLVNQNDSCSSMSRESRPPRYSQIVHEPPDFSRWTRDDEMLGRQIQDQYQSSLFVENSDSREERPPRYSYEIAASPRGRRSDETLSRQMREQCNASLDVNATRLRADHWGSKSKRPRRSSDDAQRRDRTAARRIDEEYESSLAVNHSSSTSWHPRPPSNSPPPPPFKHREHAKRTLFDSSPHYQVPQRVDIHRPESYYRHPTYRGPVPLVGENMYHPLEEPKTNRKAKEPRKEKKPQIRAKDYEHALRWLAGRRSLGGR